MTPEFSESLNGAHKPNRNKEFYFKEMTLVKSEIVGCKSTSETVEPRL